MVPHPIFNHIQPAGHMKTEEEKKSQVERFLSKSELLLFYSLAIFGFLLISV